MNLLQSLSLTCPYCGEVIDLVVDTSIPRQTLIEDCCVCCRPITLELWGDPGEPPSVTARREDEA